MDPEHARRELWQADAGRDPEIAVREQHDAHREQHGRGDPDESQPEPVVLSDEGDVVGRPVERAEQVQGIQVEPIDGPGQCQGDAGDPGRATAAEDGRQGERQAAEEQGVEAQPQREAERRER